MQAVLHTCHTFRRTRLCTQRKMDNWTIYKSWQLSKLHLMIKMRYDRKFRTSIKKTLRCDHFVNIVSFCLLKEIYLSSNHFDVISDCKKHGLKYLHGYSPVFTSKTSWISIRCTLSFLWKQICHSSCLVVIFFLPSSCWVPAERSVWLKQLQLESIFHLQPLVCGWFHFATLQIIVLWEVPDCRSVLASHLTP